MIELFFCKYTTIKQAKMKEIDKRQWKIYKRKGF